METLILMVQIVIIKVTMFFMQLFLIGCGLLFIARFIDFCTRSSDTPTAYYDSLCGVLQAGREFSHRLQGGCDCEEEEALEGEVVEEKETK
jgi:hypothetical protein